MAKTSECISSICRVIVTWHSVTLFYRFYLMHVCAFKAHITTCLKEEGISGEPENIVVCPTEGIRAKHYLRTKNHSQRFQFLKDSNSHRLHQQFGRSGTRLIKLAFESIQALSVFLLTEQPLPFLVSGITFCKGAGIRYRRHWSRLCYIAQQYIFRNVYFSKLVLYHWNFPMGKKCANVFVFVLTYCSLICRFLYHILLN